MDIIQALLNFFNVQGLILVCLIFIPLERLFSLHKEQNVFRKWWWNDLIYLFVNRLFIYGGMVVLIVGVGVLARWFVPPALTAAVAGQPIWLQVVEAIIVADIGFYSAHRMFHSVPWLWKFHAIHHSIEDLDWLAAARVHPLDQIITKGVSVLPLYALGYSEAAVGIFSAIYFWHSLLVHANLRLNIGPLRWLIVSPEFHHWHHANEPVAYNMNYAGQLSILDKLFGTFYMPVGRIPSKYGVDDPVPNTYIPHLLYPFNRQRPVEPIEAAVGDEGLAELS